ncbi:MAG: grasp-with-spasm system ATP-grasp peptide maturase [Bacteroidetes bacterium HGW-Bacteroidetes-6]|jgi:ATP-GRASP peptide maturase of grasp-with-spasm system|nr:MAG: grasp-with-spasm system ATP-grasp peptide maturase [Bacteroidetes bacterium HGW-Bacteroidetes-7]PKP04844.1 MAG: grasp-with-spasm system ATP-grasp peptide maturase [Bacteroidetes bacterium HGW-Bacteroidetes-6]
MVLIISEESDITTTEVIKWLLYYKYPKEKIIRINDNSLINIEKIIIGNIKNDLIISVDTNNTKLKLNLNNIKSVWYRRGKLNLIQTKSGNAQLDKSLSSELFSLERYINNIIDNSEIRIGRYRENFLNKLDCLKAAKEVGLKIPETLITCKKKFLNKGLLTTKAIKDVVRLPINNNQTLALGTILLDKNFIQKSPTSFFPTLFQSYIEKDYELRIFFVFQKCFPMAIFSQSNEQTKIDFRNYDRNLPNRTVPYVLPNVIKSQILRLITKLGLTSGSIDMIVTPKKEYVFLEVNPIGQFAQVSKPCNYYLEREIARLLISYKEN